jgi:glycosyltransferase involved in cell wall biosynthesis
VTGESIICFAKDWDEDPTSNNHVMAELARRNRVLWLNSISTRAPNFASGRDLGKIVRKLASFAKGARRVQDNLWVYTPIVLPLPHNRIATAANRYILRLALWLLRRKLGISDFQVWTFLPNAADYVGCLGESISVYYCVDEWAKFNYLDGARTAEAERQLVAKADVVFAVADSLVKNRRPLNPETHLARHGVDHAQFAKALDEATAIPPDLAAIPGPVLGFYGTLQDWVDLDLVSYLAERHPEWSIVLIGKPMVDLSRLKGFSNVYLLGRKPHAELPAYCKGFSVGIIPYVLNERLLHVNPIKLREYLSAGLPVVSVDLPEVAPYRGLCTIAKDYNAFERGVVDALADDSARRRRERSEAMRGETWEARVADVAAHVMRVKAARNGAAAPKRAARP